MVRVVSWRQVRVGVIDDPEINAANAGGGDFYAIPGYGKVGRALPGLVMPGPSPRGEAPSSASGSSALMYPTMTMTRVLLARLAATVGSHDSGS